LKIVERKYVDGTEFDGVSTDAVEDSKKRPRMGCIHAPAR
jgi:hypothetical protein